MSSTSDLSRVGVVIVTYASAGHITGCLDSLVDAGLGAVVVVDNDSPDDTVDVLRRRTDPSLVVVEQGNIGFGGGCNTGARALPPECDLVLFCNPDARIAAQDIGRLVQHLLDDPRRGLVGPRLHCGGSPLTSAGSAPRLLTEVRPLLPGAAGRLLPRRQLPPTADQAVEVGYVEGACMLARRSAFDEVGGFDEGFFLCFEEMDLATRMRDLGWRVELVPEAWAEHCPGQSRSSIPFAGRDHALVSLLRYLQLHEGARAARAYARCARASFWLRVRTGRMPRVDYERLRTVLVTGRTGP